jgi:hypothetical protein
VFAWRSISSIHSVLAVMEQSGLGLKRKRKVKTESVDDLQCFVEHGIHCADDLRASCFDGAGHFGRLEMKVETAVRSKYQQTLDKYQQSWSDLPDNSELKLSFDRLSKCRKASSLAAWCDYELCDQHCGHAEHWSSGCCCAGCCTLNRVDAIVVPTAELEAKRSAGEPQASAVGVE